MRWPAVVVLLAAPTARADDPRDIFGLHKKPIEAPPDCSDGRTFGCAGPTDWLADDSPAALSGWLTSAYLLGLPVGDASQDSIAHYAIGAARDENGASFAGSTSLETHWSIDGANSENARFGTNDTHVPLTFLAGIHSIAAGFSARDRVSTGGSIDAELLTGGERHVVDARIWGSWTGEPRRRDISFGAYQLRRLTTDFGPDGTISLVASGPLGTFRGGRAWYAAGIAPSVSTATLTWDSKGLFDANGDGTADLNGAGDGFLLQPIETQSRAVATWHVPAMLRAGYDRGPHHLSVSLVGHYDRDERDLALATVQAARVQRETTTVDAIATWRGIWKDTRARAQFAWHHQARVETAADPAAADIPQLLSGYIPNGLADDTTLSTACQDDDATMFQQCPIPAGFFASGGAGLLVDQFTDRPTVTADVAHRIGNHVVRAGGVFEDVRLVTQSSYTGGELDRSLFDGHFERAYFHGVGQCGELFEQACDYLATSEINVRTRYTAAYVEDTFHPTDDIAVDAGLRWELMWVGTAIHFSNELSPRVGITWDPLGSGRSKIFASLGRSYGYLPAGLGDLVLPGDRRVRDITIEGIGATRTSETGTPMPVDPDLAPIRSDEATAGLVLGWPRAVRITGWLSGRRTREIETTPIALTNPDDGHETATRQVVTAGAEVATTGKLSLRFGYLYTRAVGNATGPANPREGATLYDGTDFDFSSTNLFGRLPTDFAHRVSVEARRDGHIRGIPVAASVRLTANSGRPRDVLTFERGETDFLIPRGFGGRSAMVLQANTELFARLHAFDITLDLFNVFDRRDPTTDDDYYAINAGALPIDHGTTRDLVFAKDGSGKPIHRSTNFQYGTSFQSPIAATLGIRRAF